MADSKSLKNSILFLGGGKTALAAPFAIFIANLQAKKLRI